MKTTCKKTRSENSAHLEKTYDMYELRYLRRLQLFAPALKLDSDSWAYWEEHT